MEKDYANTIQQLVNQYYQQNISKNEYTNKRKKIIDLMDDEFNGLHYPSLNTLTNKKTTPNP